MRPYRVAIGDVSTRPMPSRMVQEILSRRVSGSVGAGLRLVEIFPAGAAEPRYPHVHNTMEEVIMVLEGEGATWVDGEWWRIVPGDVLQIPAGARHGTVNPGPGSLKLLCFFPSAVPELDYVEFPHLLLDGWDQAH